MAKRTIIENRKQKSKEKTGMIWNQKGGAILQEEYLLDAVEMIEWCDAAPSTIIPKVWMIAWRCCNAAAFSTITDNKAEEAEEDHRPPAALSTYLIILITAASSTATAGRWNERWEMEEHPPREMNLIWNASGETAWSHPHHTVWLVGRG